MIPLDWTKIVKVRDQWNNRWRREIIAAQPIAGMAYLALAGLEQALPRRGRRRPMSRSPSSAANRWRCSARRAAARPRPCACWPGSSRPIAGAIAARRRRHHAMPAHQRNMGYVFQSYALFPHMTVERNVAFGLEERGVARDERKERVAEALGMVRLNGLAHRRPRELVRRPAAARGAGARAGDPAGSAAARRIPVEPRRQAARDDAPRDPRHPALARHHHAVRHPRPGRGADDVRPHRGDESAAASSRSARRPRSTSARRRASSRASSAAPMSCRPAATRAAALPSGAARFRAEAPRGGRDRRLRPAAAHALVAAVRAGRRPVRRA